MIKISGRATVLVDYEVELDLTEDEFYELTEKKQNELLESAIDWWDALRNGQTDEIEVDDIEEV
ncbi:hypothetical protein ACFQ5D_18055 [Paenibacillus farraposensis]|uniref:Uncharacterized protein n=1 Tax=Paenibacillus farraposensis TaxID=2807095 RepID=A0ABW4DF19_9BACL|nr:hypothetical protein [Paenibacillus farraposensis]MCC3381934.1 hypothetical protein [Paenibacillus farraposensis]